ncbi:MAG: O-antigen ligase family protein [Marinilabiliaceae bacterium]
MVIENSNIYSLRFWIHWYFFALVLAPIVCFIDYHSIEQGFERIYGGTLMMIALLLLIGRGSGNVVIRNYIPVGVFLAVYYLSWDIVLWQNLIARKGIFYEFLLNRTLHAVAILFIVDNIVFSRKLIDTLVVLMKGLVVVGAVVSLVQVIHDPFFFAPERFQESMLHYRWGTDPLQVRRLSIFGFTNVHDIGLSFLPVFALITGYEVKEKGRIPIVIMLLAFFIAVVNNSRYVQAGYFIAAAPALFYQGRVIRNSLIAIGGLVVLVLFMGLVLQVVGYDVERYIDERILAETAGTRILALEIFLRFFPDNPVFGTGVHLTEDVEVALAERSSQIHVGYLAHLFSYGVIGTFLALFFWGLIAWRLWQVGRRTGFYGSFFGFMIFLWANITMVYYWVFTFGLALCYLFASYYDKKEDEPS